MFTRARIFSAFVLIGICSNALAVTGSTTFTVDAGPLAGQGVGFSTDGCDGSDFGSVATPVLSDGKKVCALYEQDLYPFADNQLYLVIDGFTSDPGINYFNILSLSCGLGLAAGSAAYYYYPGTGGSSGQASWTIDIYSISCIYNIIPGGTASLSID
jgi:hypothetical protein